MSANNSPLKTGRYTTFNISDKSEDESEEICQREWHNYIAKCDQQCEDYQKNYLNAKSDKNKSDHFAFEYGKQAYEKNDLLEKCAIPFGSNRLTLNSSLENKTDSFLTKNRLQTNYIKSKKCYESSKNANEENFHSRFKNNCNNYQNNNCDNDWSNDQNNSNFKSQVKWTSNGNKNNSKNILNNSCLETNLTENNWDRDMYNNDSNSIKNKENAFQRAEKKITYNGFDKSFENINVGKSVFRKNNTFKGLPTKGNTNLEYLKNTNLLGFSFLSGREKNHLANFKSLEDCNDAKNEYNQKQIPKNGLPSINNDSLLEYCAESNKNVESSKEKNFASVSVQTDPIDCCSSKTRTIFYYAEKETIQLNPGFQYIFTIDNKSNQIINVDQRLMSFTNTKI